MKKLLLSLLCFLTVSVASAQEEEWTRRVLIEEFTTEKCQYCPDAAKGLESFHKAFPAVAAKTVTICHHAGYGEDWLTIPADYEYLWLYGGSTYAPAFMWDRYHFDDNEKSLTSPVEGRPSGPAAHKKKVQTRLDIAPEVKIDLAASFNDAGNKIIVTVNCKTKKDFSANPARLTVFVTEDNIPEHYQQGTSEKFIHQHVGRAVNETWGAELSWDDSNEAAYSYTFDVNANWKKEDLKVVAFVSCYDQFNVGNCVVENATDVVPADPTGIEEANTTREVRELARYSLDGRQLSQPESGVNIVRLFDGKVVKVAVR